MKKIALSGKYGKGKFALVDDADYGWLSQRKWQVTQGGYATRSGYRDGRIIGRLLMHREIMTPPRGMQVDHINGNRLDNRRSNLRFCSHTENCHNRRPENKTGYKGVRATPYGKWLARITIDRVRVELGRFDTPQEAALAYNQAARSHFGDFARLNQV